MDTSPSDAGASEGSEIEKDVMGLTRIKADSSNFEGTDRTASNEGIEVEAIEFDKANYKKDDGIPKRLLLFILASVVILAASAGAGFAVLNSKKKGSTTMAFSSEDATQSSNATKNEIEAPVIDDAEPEQTMNASDVTESSNSLPTAAPTARATEQDSVFGSASDSFSDEGESLWSDALDEAAEAETSGEDVSAVESDSGLVLPGSDNISTSSTATSAESSEPDSLWSDPVCPNDDVAVSSACASGSASSISTASFCFVSKHDGDWYWLRSASEGGPSPAYDSWDYIDETKGELTILDLNEGNYIISLVRDSMEPYDEIVSHEFTVPECQ